MAATLDTYLARLPERVAAESVDPLARTALPGGPFLKQLRDAGLFWRSGALLGTHVLATGLLLTSWVFVGYGALSGRFDYGWLAAWALALASTLPLRAASRWLEGVIAVGFGGLLKERLLAGAMAIDAEFVRKRGAGELLSEVLESEAIDGLGASGGLETVLALLELLMAPVLLVWGAASGLESGVLTAWMLLALALMAGNLRQRTDWTTLRLGLTHRLVENMIAHRTRLAQQPPSQWHREEDRDAERYLSESQAFDSSTARIEAALPRGYAIAAVAVLVPTIVVGSATLAQLAVTLGVILFASAALERLTFGFSRAAAAWVAWRTVEPMFEAAARPVERGVAVDASATLARVLEAQDLVFTHESRSEPVLRGCSLSLDRGDKILLEGDTGSGKSTLASLLAGSRRPSAGFVLSGGLDLHTLGEAAWRRRIALAPQYHENHILSAPLGFNLLMSRPYPHDEKDQEEARELCHALGLGPLLERMPSGLDQMVGETGWRLSHGERSRIYLARALLQDAEVVLLDESLAALDPENLRQCLGCVIRWAKTLVVVAHP